MELSPPGESRPDAQDVSPRVERQAFCDTLQALHPACPICLEGATGATPDTVYLLACNHWVHKKCAQSLRSDACPLCRRSLRDSIPSVVHARIVARQRADRMFPLADFDLSGESESGSETPPGPAQERAVWMTFFLSVSWRLDHEGENALGGGAARPVPREGTESTRTASRGDEDTSGDGATRPIPREDIWDAILGLLELRRAALSRRSNQPSPRDQSPLPRPFSPIWYQRPDEDERA